MRSWTITEEDVQAIAGDLLNRELTTDELDEVFVEIRKYGDKTFLPDLEDFIEKHFEIEE